MTEPLVIGAALTVPHLPRYVDWLREGDRDLELQDLCEPGALTGDWSGLVAEARRLLDGWGGRLGIHGPFAGFSLATEDPEVREIVQRRLDRALDACAALGADQMVIHSPVTTWAHFNRGNRPGAETAMLETFHGVLRPALHRARDMGVVLVLENVEDIDPRARVEMVAAIGSPSLRVSLDTGHAHYAHVTTGGPPVDYFVAAAGDLLEHVHLQDADGRADRHWPPGRGSVPWHAVFAALGRLGSRPRLLLEMSDPAFVTEGAGWLAGARLAT